MSDEIIEAIGVIERRFPTGITMPENKLPNALKTIRAHIAAQAEKIAKLEEHKFGTEAEIARLNGVIQSAHPMFKKLEADNKRLREAQQRAEVCLAHKLPEEAYRHLREAALAQTEKKPEPCQTCGGKGFLWNETKSFPNPRDKDCPTCNGTGREVG